MSADVHILNDSIVRVTEIDAPAIGISVIDVGDLVVMPGLVDTHVHINEPGRTDWEGFETATRAAAAGGVTTLLDMPLNSTPAATTVAALRAKREAAAGKCAVDVGFLGGVIPGNAEELAGLWEGGVFAFKCFLVHSGVDDFPNVTEADLRVAMPILSGLGATLMVHAELPGPIDAAARRRTQPTPEGAIESDVGDVRIYESYLRSRPPSAEHEAIELIIHLSREFGTRVHIVHLSSADAVPMLSRAREESLPITVETCPHYLTFAAEEIPVGATEYKCAPPIRGRANRERLWQALGDGVIDMIVSDHSPCPPALKQLASGDFARAWGGVASLQLGLPAVWSGAKQRGYSLDQVARWMSGTPARIAGLGMRLGAIEPGRIANLVIWNPEAEVLVNPKLLHHRHKITPYAGLTLRGSVESTWLRGSRIYHGSEFGAPASGEILVRGP